MRLRKDFINSMNRKSDVLCKIYSISLSLNLNIIDDSKYWVKILNQKILKCIHQ